MDMLAVAAESTPAPWWGVASIGFLGGLVGSAAALLGGMVSDRRKARHEDTIQWDKEVVTVSQQFLSSINNVLDSRPASLRSTPPDDEELRTFGRIRDEEARVQKARIQQLELIAPALRPKAEALRSACDDLVSERFDIVEGRPVKREMTFAGFTKVRSEFVAAVVHLIHR